MNQNETAVPKPPRHVDFFFHNKISVSILLVIVIIPPILLPGLGSLISMIVMLAAFFACLKAGSPRLIGLTKPASWISTLISGALWGVGLGILFQLVLDPLFEMLTGSAIDLSNLDSMKGDLPNYLIWLAIGWIIGGLLEEMTFRGYLMTRVWALAGDKGFGTFLALVLSAVPFGIAHLYQGWAGVLSTGTMGLCFALIFVRNRANLWIPIFAHGFANTVGVTVIFLDWSASFRLL